MDPGKEKDDLEGALSAVAIIAEAVRGTGDKEREILLGRALGRASRDGRTSAQEMVAAEVGVESGELDEWSRTRTHEEIASALDRVANRVRTHLTVMVHPDQVPEVLKGHPNGLIYLPPGMVRDIYAFGEAVADVLDGKGGGDRVETSGKKLMEEAAEWVRNTRKRWGVPEGWRLVQVRPESDAVVGTELPF